VRVMTVYKAKGLEFPVVILADPTYSATRDRPSRHIDSSRSIWLEPLCGAAPVELFEASDRELKRDRAEAIRVAYVAATRARDLLVLPACGDQPIEGWFEVLNPVLYPFDAVRRNSVPAPGCPAFGEESVLERGPKGKRPVAGSVRPGLHMAEPDAAPVTWWDPASLDPEIEQLAPLRHQRLLEIDSGGVTAAESTRNYETWKTERRALLARGSEPSMQVQTVTALVRSSEGSELRTEPSVDLQVVDRDDVDRPGGRRFGTLVHALLALIDLESTTDALKKTAAVQGRMLGATEEEIDAAVAIVSRALVHSILRTAAASARAGRLRREVPVMLRKDDGSLVEGVVDLAFQQEASDFAGWTVVDFKTDHEFGGPSDRYLDQVRWYSTAVREATNLPTRGVLLVI
jgi:ATP-dependent helicase/nuclease subunit A